MPYGISRPQAATGEGTSVFDIKNLFKDNRSSPVSLEVPSKSGSRVAVEAAMAASPLDDGFVRLKNNNNNLV